ncbi:MAG TPA: type II 3-dehydroquinate dehydratase [bacterium]|nr:type II 3-dehydroquinate dehydratase [bacterium]
MSGRKRILVVHGPNLNLLGEREPDVYGELTLEVLNKQIRDYATSRNLDVVFFQSNHEGAVIDFLHENRKKADGLVINPGALTHYSYALRDAIAGIRIPAVEVHLSDIHAREAFRKISVIREVCIGQIGGLGTDSYLRGIDRLLSFFSEGA